MVCKISQPKKGPWENGHWLRNNFAAPKHCYENRFLLRNGFVASYPPLRKFLQLQSDPLAHECHFAASYPRFAAAKSLRNPPHLKIPKFAAEPHFVGGFTAAKPPLGTRVPFHSSIPSFHSCEICPPPLRYENSHLLRK